LLGVSPSKLRTPTKVSRGHAFSGDCLLALASADGLATGSRVLLANLSRWSLGLISLEYADSSERNIGSRVR
jgi:hypothetical protein